MSSPSSTPYSRTLYAGAFIVLLAMGVRATFGLFMQPTGVDQGWVRGVFSMAFAIPNFAWGVGSILAGMLAERYGSARTIVLCAAFRPAERRVGTRCVSTCSYSWSTD